MTHATTSSSTADAPSRAFGRMTGGMYLLAMTGIGLVYGFSQTLPGPEAAIIGVRFARGLFEATILAGAVGLAFYLLTALALYRVFQNTSKGAAAALVMFVAASIPLSLGALARMLDIVALVDTASGLTPALAIEQLRAPVQVALQGYESMMLMSALFWGLWLIPLGWLVYRSRIAPRAVGVAAMLGSLFYLVMFAAAIVDPGFESSAVGRVVGTATFIPAMIGEFGICAWLLIFGGRPAGMRVKRDRVAMPYAAAAA